MIVIIHIRRLEWCTSSSDRCVKCNILERASHFATREPSKISTLLSWWTFRVFLGYLQYKNSSYVCQTKYYYSCLIVCEMCLHSTDNTLKDCPVHNKNINSGIKGIISTQIVFHLMSYTMHQRKCLTYDGYSYNFVTIGVNQVRSDAHHQSAFIPSWYCVEKTFLLLEKNRNEKLNDYTVFSREQLHPAQVDVSKISWHDPMFTQECRLITSLELVLPQSSIGS